MAGILGRRELKETSGAFLEGLLSGIERKTGWLVAEQAGAERRIGCNRLLGRSRGDAEALRDAVRVYAMGALADADGVLVADETGFLKKSKHSVGRLAWPGNILAAGTHRELSHRRCSCPMPAAGVMR